MKPSEPTRVFILDDHPLICQGLAALLETEDDFTVSGQAEDTKTALSLLEKAPTDVVILDIGLKDTDGLEALKEIKARFPAIKVLVFSGQDELVYAPRLVRAGASGYVMKGEPHDTLLKALRIVASGNVHFSSGLETQFIKTLLGGKTAPVKSPIELLSDRELEIFSLFGQGYPTREIAKRLNLSVKTIDSHRCHIKEKLQIHTATELVHRAVQWVQHGVG